MAVGNCRPHNRFNCDRCKAKRVHPVAPSVAVLEAERFGEGLDAWEAQLQQEATYPSTSESW